MHLHDVRHVSDSLKTVVLLKTLCMTVPATLAWLNVSMYHLDIAIILQKYPSFW